MARYESDDNAELRPLGEAAHVPDHELDTDCKDRRRDPRCSRSPADSGSPLECRSCGASIPTSRTKCRFCLSNHVEPLDVNDDTADETSLLHVIHMVVPAASRYAAVAKGTSAASFVPRNDGTITNCDLVADLDAEPAQQLVKRWGALRAVVQVTADIGQQLLATARERTPGMDAGRSRVDCEAHATFLSDEAGHGIESDERLTALLEDDNNLWLVPPLALHQLSNDDHDGESRHRRAPIREQLPCRACGRDTHHRFYGTGNVPDERWSGQSIWECRVCGAVRHGPPRQTG